jgi:hypothetical protein
MIDKKYNLNKIEYLLKNIYRERIKINQNKIKKIKK